MPAQIIVRKLSRQQVEKSIIDQNVKDLVTLTEEDGLLILASKSHFPGNPKASAAIQTIADADSVLILADAAKNAS